VSYKGQVSDPIEGGWWRDGPSEYTGDFVQPPVDPSDNLPVPPGGACDCLPPDLFPFPVPESPEEPPIIIE